MSLKASVIYGIAEDIRGRNEGTLTKRGAYRKENHKMKIQEIREVAKAWNVDTKVGRSKLDIVRDIQTAEGYSPCFRTKDACWEDCLWREDCIDAG